MASLILLVVVSVPLAVMVVAVLNAIEDRFADER